MHLVARDAAKLESLASELQASWTPADVLEEKAFARVAERAPQPLGGMVYAIGSINLKPVGRITMADLDRDYRLNAAGAALAVQAALPSMRAAHGGASIVLFSSVAAACGFPLHMSIGMAKAAIGGLTRSAAAELAPSIRVNAIAPSLTQTPLADGVLSSPKSRDHIAAKHPLGRLGQPEDLAHLAAFLLSPDSSWITGQIIGVDGGRGTIAVA